MLETVIQDKLKSALKAGDKVVVSVHRMLISALKNKKIDDGVKELDDEKVLGVIRKMVKQHKESIQSFEKGGRDDLVSKERQEMGVLEKYLPEPLSSEELSGIISETIDQLGAASMKDMGKVMKEVTSKVKGRADGKMISEIVKEKLT